MNDFLSVCFWTALAVFVAATLFDWKFEYRIAEPDSIGCRYFRIAAETHNFNLSICSKR